MRGRPKSPTLILVEHVSGVIDVATVAKAAGGPQKLAGHQFTLSAGGPSGMRTDTTVRLVTTYPHFGGTRYWFACPRCQRRCGKLYATEAHPGVACRRCHGLEYFLQRRKSLSQAFWHWAAYHGGRTRPTKKVERLALAYQDCLDKGEKFVMGRW
jgi:hypothetical protein